MAPFSMTKMRLKPTAGPEEASNTGAAPASAVQESPQDKAWAKQKAEELKRELAEAEADRVVEYDVKAHKQ